MAPAWNTTLQLITTTSSGGCSSRRMQCSSSSTSSMGELCCCCVWWCAVPTGAAAAAAAVCRRTHQQHHAIARSGWWLNSTQLMKQPLGYACYAYTTTTRLECWWYCTCILFYWDSTVCWYWLPLSIMLYCIYPSVLPSSALEWASACDGLVVHQFQIGSIDPRTVGSYVTTKVNSPSDNEWIQRFLLGSVDQRQDGISHLAPYLCLSGYRWYRTIFRNADSKRFEDSTFW